MSKYWKIEIWLWSSLNFLVLSILAVNIQNSNKSYLKTKHLRAQKNCYCFVKWPPLVVLMWMYSYFKYVFSMATYCTKLQSACITFIAIKIVLWVIMPLLWWHCVLPIRWRLRVGHTQILGVCIPTTNTGRPWSTFVLQMMMFSPQKYYSDSAYSAGTCNLDLANGAIHPTTGLLRIKNNFNRHVDCEKDAIVICKNIRLACRRVQLLHDGRLPLGAGVLLRRRGKTIPLQRWLGRRKHCGVKQNGVHPYIS